MFRKAFGYSYGIKCGFESQRLLRKRRPGNSGAVVAGFMTMLPDDL
jgi:hypothetical protein